jgi:hypothetical protein
MLQVLDPFRFVLIAVAGWMNQLEYQITDYLREENPGAARATRPTAAPV